MKKREKFLLAFVISWCVVMIFYIVWMTKIANYRVGIAREEHEWLFENDTDFYNLTDEAKQYFEGELKYYEDDLKYFLEEATFEEKLAIMATRYDILNINSYFWEAYMYDTVASFMLGAFTVSSWLTLIIYSIITIEFKNKKQYFIDNVKLILSIVILFMLIYGIQYLQEYIIGFYDIVGGEYTWDDIVQLIQWDIMSILQGTVITFIIIFIPNVIINLVKRKKQKIQEKANMEENK